MGCRSNFITQDTSSQWPEWFCEKYASTIWFPPNRTGSLHSLQESKTYKQWLDLPEDIQQAITWKTPNETFILIYLHECRGITQCQISKDSIKWSEPTGWQLVREVTHYYCHDCSYPQFDTENSSV